MISITIINVMISLLMFFFFRFEVDRTAFEKNRIAFFVGLNVTRNSEVKVFYKFIIE